MRHIWKWPLVVTDRQELLVPAGARLLAVQAQYGELCLWAECDTSQPKETRTIHVYGTGNPIPDDPGTYISTVQLGTFVWHVYEVPS